MMTSNLWRYCSKGIFWSALLVVLAACLAPIDAQGPINHFDKIVHFGSFALLTGLCFLAYPAISTNALLTCHVQAACLCSFGLLIEIAQSFTAYRFFSWWDFVADSAGVFVVWLIYLRFVIPNGREKTNEHPSNI